MRRPENTRRLLPEHGPWRRDLRLDDRRRTRPSVRVDVRRGVASGRRSGRRDLHRMFAGTGVQAAARPTPPPSCPAADLVTPSVAVVVSVHEWGQTMRPRVLAVIGLASSVTTLVC